MKDCLIISPIADQSTPDRKEIYRRAKYLEKKIAAALKPLGFEAKLITSDRTKDWITPKMIERLVSDDLAIAVLDGANPNCMYEVGIRHALCRPVICLIETQDAGPKLPFNIQDVDPLQYPQLPPGGVWQKRDARKFQDDLRERVRKMASMPSPLFAAALSQASTEALLRMIFEQKQVQVNALKNELVKFKRNLRHDYEVSNVISAETADRFFQMVDSSNTRLMHSNDVLRALAQQPKLLRLATGRDDCLSICEDIEVLADKVADVGRDLMRVANPPVTGSISIRRTQQEQIRRHIQRVLDTEAQHVRELIDEMMRIDVFTLANRVAGLGRRLTFASAFQTTACTRQQIDQQLETILAEADKLSVRIGSLLERGTI